MTTLISYISIDNSSSNDHLYRRDIYQLLTDCITEFKWIRLQLLASFHKKRMIYSRKGQIIFK